MKILNIIIIASIISISLLSCDKVDAPYKEEVEKPIDTTNKIHKKVLLEDFTGHKCINCPAAHEIGHDLTNIYGEDNLIIASIHAGFYASPQNAPFDYDFRTVAGSDYANFFGVQNYPMGLVDRINDGGDYLLDVNKWGSTIAQQFNETANLGITINPNLQVDKLSAEIKLQFVSTVSKAASIQIWIVEDSIIKAQTTPEGDVTDYVHNHVLRKAVNGTWGENLPATNYQNGDEETISFSDFQLGSDWVAEQLSLIVFVYDNESKRVLQVEEKKITN